LILRAFGHRLDGAGDVSRRRTRLRPHPYVAETQRPKNDRFRRGAILPLINRTGFQSSSPFRCRSCQKASKMLEEVWRGSDDDLYQDPLLGRSHHR
jgi:hypothetical protein